MCGRYAQYRTGGDLESELGATFDGDAPSPRYNIAPGSQVLVCRADSTGARSFAMLHWGLIPSWSKDRKIGYRTINARAETVADKPAFRAALKHRRCLIPADGFYEWTTTPSGKQPYFISRADRRPIAFAGLWEHWTDQDTGEQVQSCTIIVTEANALVRAIHDRMPVILQPEDYGLWLDPRVRVREPLEPLLRPLDPELMAMHPVDRRVNRPQQDDPGLIEPIELESRACWTP
jgi:putative SOS response-associated peptidase YedK